MDEDYTVVFVLQTLLVVAEFQLRKYKIHVSVVSQSDMLQTLIHLVVQTLSDCRCQNYVLTCI